VTAAGPACGVAVAARHQLIVAADVADALITWTMFMLLNLLR